MNPVPLPQADTCAGATVSFGNPPVSGQVWYNAATNEFYIVPAEEVPNHIARLADKKGK